MGTVINKKFIAASHIHQMMLDADVSNVKCLAFANADVAEFTVKAGSRITRSQVKDVEHSKGSYYRRTHQKTEKVSWLQVTPPSWKTTT